MLDGTELQFRVPGLSGAADKTLMSVRRLPEACLPQPSQAGGLHGQTNQVCFQLCSSPWSGFRLLLLGISLLQSWPMGLLDPCPEKPSLPCFPFCQLVTGFGHVQVELALLSFPPPLQSSPKAGCVLHCPPLCSWGCCGAVQRGTLHGQELGGISLPQDQTRCHLLPQVL